MSEVGAQMDIDQPSRASLPLTKQGAPVQKSVEGYVIIVQNVHEETSEEDLQEYFEDFGKVQNVHLNLDRQTGYVKGYALVEYKTLEEAQKAIEEGDGEELLGHILSVDYAFTEDHKGVDTSMKDEERKRDQSPERA